MRSLRSLGGAYWGEHTNEIGQATFMHSFSNNPPIESVSEEVGKALYASAVLADESSDQ